ncbi:uncharacterized protein CC84DRAFT_800995 [Paraphaeosphaeria sporulosa]|uniref:Uncharacterized protein n=1 Tax=Paraphaeosphaeria sporulosa TaxID=1460663 RepID=A0A177CDD1_9PLEO|nr:uncharacterized protein CC84DRAFT_800995 [Paraphaeosphaeria sporulosa]OAG04710.1 hypothetical protein CC84DRAFT_800995 [Paraphaeosphaeria sporulosa]
MPPPVTRSSPSGPSRGGSRRRGTTRSGSAAPGSPHLSVPGSSRSTPASNTSTTTRSGQIVVPSLKARESQNARFADATESPMVIPPNEILVYAATTTGEDIPRTYAEAMSDTNALLWRPPIAHEIRAHETNRTYDIVNIEDLPLSIRLVGT